MKSRVLPVILTKSEAASRCTRKRPGGRNAAGEKLIQAHQKLADKRWGQATKGQRVPTAKQACEMARYIKQATKAAQAGCTARLIGPQDVILAARDASNHGSASRDGGKVTASSYGYRWSTSKARATRIDTGEVEVNISRTVSHTIARPGKWWHNISLDTGLLLPGDHVAIKKKGHWVRIDSEGDTNGVSIRMPVDISNFGKWEHGVSLEECVAEIEKKRAIDKQAKETKKAGERRARRIERAAKILAHWSVREIGASDVAAVGACRAGIEAWAISHGLAIDAKLPLAEIAKDEAGAVWALRIARKLATELVA